MCVKKTFLILLTITIIFFSCRDKPSTVSIPIIPRDTSITRFNAYTNLALDSNYIQKFIDSEVKNEETAIKIKNFYNSRNNQYAWFNEEGLTEQAEAFWRLHQSTFNLSGDSTIYNRQLNEYMASLLNEDSTVVMPDIKRNIELNLTFHFYKFARITFSNKVNPEELQWHIPKRKLETTAMLDSFLNQSQKDWRPMNASFYRFRDKVFQYSEISKIGGWQKIEMKQKQLKAGNKDSIIIRLKERLALTGDYNGEDSSALFSHELEKAVKRIQKSYGHRQTGVLDESLIKELNVPIEERIRQMLINIERMRWMPEENKRYIVANIPDYRLYLVEADTVILDIDIVVGKSANKTVIFTDKLKYIVFSPYWNVPRSIIRNEIVPAMNRNSNYLSRNNMEITGMSNGLPVVRQRPGRNNALGKVKFIFPNTYNIYFHDTPSKSLFEKEKRSFSHGCIRLAKPFELAKYLLRDKPEWTDDRIRKAMNRNSEQWVTLTESVPVFIVYFTSWVDKKGLLHFRDDIYQHDSRMASHLFK